MHQMDFGPGPTVCATSISVMGYMTVSITGQITIMGFAYHIAYNIQWGMDSVS